MDILKEVVAGADTVLNGDQQEDKQASSQENQQ